jgi:hypothetical protein
MHSFLAPIVHLFPGMYPNMFVQMNLCLYEKEGECLYESTYKVSE